VGRIRTIKPEFPQSESMGCVSRDARLCYIMLWTLADDGGRLRGNSRMLASLLYPYDNDAPKLIDRWLTELAEQKCIIRYEAEGHQYVQIEKWLEHQKIDHAKESKLPPPSEDSRSVANVREASIIGALDQGRDQGSRIKDQGRASADESDGFEEFYEAYPKHVGRGKARLAYKAALKKTTASALLEGARIYAASVASTEDRFVAMPATWLNGERWLDEIAASDGSKVVPIDWSAFNTPEERDAQEKRKLGNG